MSNWDVLVSDDELRKAYRERNKEYVEDKIQRDSLTSYEADGWVLSREYKDHRYVKVKKQKSCGDRFENKVWKLFYSMGFTVMNRDNSFVISYGKNDSSLTKQIDVFAMDEETALVIECKASEQPDTKKDFKKEIEAIGGYRKQIIAEIRKRFDKGTKVKFIFATSNCIVGDRDQSRLDEFDVAYFDEETVDYYIELAQHLGSSAKYQLLGMLFEGITIENMPDTVPAIRGKMGGLTYYSFSIEPERLLKIGFVLHRRDANRVAFPTYQRIIKKNRLQQIRDFIDNGGYFPNSVIVSINTAKKKGARKRGLVFDLKHGDGKSIADLGVLHLPQKYCSAYIIDGQHRLYGYSGSRYASTNTIPVVAFEDLDETDQVRLFMEINENQKAVPKNLRNTLSSDLLWASENYSDRRRALRLHVAMALGEDRDSPLKGHVLIGENKKTSVRCVTMDSIDKGLENGCFLATFKKTNSVDAPGLFDTGEPDNDAVLSELLPFLKKVFRYVEAQLPDEWNRGEEDWGLLTNNSGVQAWLRILSDIMVFLAAQSIKSSYPRGVQPDSLVEDARQLLDAIIDFYKNLTPELRDEIRSQYGSNGPKQHWRYLQKAIHDRYSEFSPDGYEEWWANNSKQYNDSTSDMIGEIEAEVIKRIRSKLQEIGCDLPMALQKDLNGRIYEENVRRRDRGETPLDNWDAFTLADSLVLVKQGSYWSDGLKAILTPAGQEGRRGGSKIEKTKWLEDLRRIQNGLKKTSYSVKQADHVYVSAIYAWLFDGEEA